MIAATVDRADILVGARPFALPPTHGSIPMRSNVPQPAWEAHWPGFAKTMRRRAGSGEIDFPERPLVRSGSARARARHRGRRRHRNAGHGRRYRHEPVLRRCLPLHAVGGAGVSPKRPCRKPDRASPPVSRLPTSHATGRPAASSLTSASTRRSSKSAPDGEARGRTTGKTIRPTAAPATCSRRRPRQAEGMAQPMAHAAMAGQGTCIDCLTASRTRRQTRRTVGGSHRVHGPSRHPCSTESRTTLVDAYVTRAKPRFGAPRRLAAPSYFSPLTSTSTRRFGCRHAISSFRFF